MAVNVRAVLGPELLDDLVHRFRVGDRRRERSGGRVRECSGCGRGSGLVSSCRNLAAAAAFPLLGVARLLQGIPSTIGANFLFAVPLTADVIDDDSARTDLRREVTYFGASSFVQRTAAAVAPLIVVLLRLLADTRGHMLGVPLVGPVAGRVLAGAYLRFRAYDLPNEVAARVRPEAP